MVERSDNDQRPSWIDDLAEHVEQKVAEPAFQRDTSFLEKLLPLMEIFSRYFDAEVRGFENLPDEGPMLIVGNHSGGTLVPDTSAFISAWYRERGLDAPLVGLAFDAMFGIPGVETLMRKLGEVPANPENAAQALEEGAAVLVYPGGAHEAFRPWTERNRIDFGGHQGFVKLALRAGVPVVPVVAHGGHDTTVVLSRGDRLAKWTGLERLRIDIVPLLFQLPWGVSTALQLGVPLPARITLQILPAIDWSTLGPEAADEPETVQRCYDGITQRMQQTLTELARERPHPVLDRIFRRRASRPNSSEGA